MMCCRHDGEGSFHLFLLLTVAGKLFVVLAHQTDTQLGNSVTLPCQCNYSTDTPVDLLDVQWWTGDNLITRFHLGRLIQGSRYINRTDLPAKGIRKGDFSLYINHTEYSDRGRYRCVLNKDGQNITLGEVDLEVKVPGSHLFVESGQRVNLSCFGRVDWSGPEAAFVQWKRGGQEVLQWKSGSLYVDPEFRGRVSVPKETIRDGDISLIFSDTHLDDQGNYVCYFKKNNYIRPATVINLTVTEHMSRVNVSLGSQLHLPLPLPNETALTLSFLPDGGKYTVSVCDIEGHLLTKCDYTHRTLLNDNTLILKNITSADSGTFIMKDKDTRITRNVVIIQVLSAGTEKDAFGPSLEGVIRSGIILSILLSVCFKYLCGKKTSSNEQEIPEMDQLEQKETEMHPLHSTEVIIQDKSASLKRAIKYIKKRTKNNFLDCFE